MSSSVSKAPYYYVPAPTRHPIVTSLGLLAFGWGASLWVNGSTPGMILCLAGIAWTIASLYIWFGDAIGEAKI
jgi:cytochrome c oxidase subunit 3